MTREDIVRWAREVELEKTGHDYPHSDEFIEWCERFAALVAAAERDSMCEQFNIPKKLAHEKAKSNEADRTAVLGKG